MIKKPTLENTRNQIAETKRALKALALNAPESFPVAPRVEHNKKVCRLQQKLDRLKKLEIILNR